MGDRTTAPREAVMVPREVLNLVPNRVPNLHLMTVKMEVATEEVMVMEVEMAEELVGYNADGGDDDDDSNTDTMRGESVFGDVKLAVLNLSLCIWTVPCCWRAPSL